MLINTNKRKLLLKKRVQFPLGCLWYTKMAAVLLFWNTNMVAVTSCEYALILMWESYLSRTHVKVFYFLWFIDFVFRFRRVIFSWAFESSEPCSWVWQACYTHHSSAQTGNLPSLSQNSFLVWWPGEVKVMSRKNLVRGFSKIQLVVYYQRCVLIGWATTRLYVIAH